MFHSGAYEELDTFSPESVDSFLRNRWTASSGIGGQIGPEFAWSIHGSSQPARGGL